MKKYIYVLIGGKPYYIEIDDELDKSLRNTLKDDYQFDSNGLLITNTDNSISLKQNILKSFLNLSNRYDINDTLKKEIEEQEKFTQSSNMYTSDISKLEEVLGQAAQTYVSVRESATKVGETASRTQNTTKEMTSQLKQFEEELKEAALDEELKNYVHSEEISQVLNRVVICSSMEEFAQITGEDIGHFDEEAYIEKVTSYKNERIVLPPEIKSDDVALKVYGSLASGSQLVTVIKKYTDKKKAFNGEIDKAFNELGVNLKVRGLDNDNLNYFGDIFIQELTRVCMATGESPEAMFRDYFNSYSENKRYNTSLDKFIRGYIKANGGNNELRGLIEATLVKKAISNNLISYKYNNYLKESYQNLDVTSGGRIQFSNQIFNDIKLTGSSHINSQIEGLINHATNVDIVAKPKGGVDGVQSSTTHEANLENKFQSEESNKNIEDNRDVNSFTAHKANLEKDYQKNGDFSKGNGAGVNALGVASGVGTSQIMAAQANRRMIGATKKALGAGVVGGKVSLNAGGAKANVRVDNPDLAVGGFHKNAVFNPTLFNDEEQMGENIDSEGAIPQEGENTGDVASNQENNVNNDNNSDGVSAPIQSNNDNNGIKGKIGKGAKSFFKKYKRKIIVIGGAIGFVVLLLFLLLGGEAEAAGSMDSACNYNETTVTVTNCYQGDSDKQVLDTLSIEDYVIGATYAYTKGETYSDDAIKALMIAIKTSALSYGNYNSTSKNVEVKSCSQQIHYCDITDGCQSEDYEIQLEAASSTYSSKLQSLYSDISNYVYVSVSYDSAITSLSTANALSINDSTLSEFESLASSGSSYTDILASVYSIEGEEESVTVNSDTFFIGDSRTVGMQQAGVISDSNSVALVGAGYTWFNDTAISSANSKMNSSTNYNIIIWLGVNDLSVSNANKYFNKYKELATGDWSNHQIYVAKVGPVNDAGSSNATTAGVNEFNSTMQSLISSAGISNLHYMDISYNITYYDDMGVHYNAENYKNIYNSMMSGLGTSISSQKKLYNLTDYCAYLDTTGLDNDLFWWPVGSTQTTTTNGVTFASGAPAITSISSNFSMSRTINGKTRAHYGIDVGSGGQIGVYNLIATKSGTVIKVNNNCADNGSYGNKCGGERGNYVYIDHGDGIVTVTQHMAANSVTVKVGDYVEQGQVIGKIGMSGSCTGAHLHFELHVNDTPVDPLEYVNPENPRPVSISTSLSGDTSDGKNFVCKSLLSSGFSQNAVVGILVNLAVEGGFNATNLENCYEENQCCKVNGKNYGYCAHPEIKGFGSDSLYTKGVDSGAYSRSNFVKDQAGYGLVQWTSSNRKANLYDYAKKRGSSIGSVSMQTEFFLQELKDSYSAVYKYLLSNNSAYNMAVYFCQKYERPAGSCSARASSGVSSMTSYVSNGCK